jgi:hypothetical protein
MEEAIINALIAAGTMKGIRDNIFYALPHNLLIDVLKKYKRINTKKVIARLLIIRDKHQPFIITTHIYKYFDRYYFRMPA